MTTSIVVGVDGSPGSLDALRWAQAVAGSDTLVRPVVAWTYLVDTAGAGDGFSVPTVPVDLLEDNAKRILDDALAAVPADGVDRVGETRGGMSDAGALLDVAADADLLVVGTRPHSSLERILGTVATQCAQYAPCPFVAVPESAPPLGDLVAVAFDGSDGSRAALHWAAAVTERLGLALRVITAWERTGPPGSLPLPDDPVASDDRAIQALRDAVTAEVPGLGDRAEFRAVERSRHVAASLLEAADGASVFVTGSRGRGGFRGLLLGSVSQRCLESSSIPVVVVRD